MKNQLAKTIGIIVFVVFLGFLRIDKVNAAAMGCYYENSDGAVSLEIPDSYSKPTAHKIYNYKKNSSNILSTSVENWYLSDIKNLSYSVGPIWNSTTHRYTDYTNYNAYDDAWNNEKCPAYLVVVLGDGPFARYHIFMSSSSELSNVKKYAEDYINNGLTKPVSYSVALPLKSATNNSDPGDGSSSSVTAKHCSCADSSHAGYRVHGVFNIAENSSLSAPTVSLQYNTESKSMVVMNWANRSNTPSTTYTALDDISSNNACPDNLLYVRRSFAIDYVYLSDSANVNVIKSDLARKHNTSTDNIYVAACEEDNQVTVPGGNETRPKPQYDNPEVAQGVVTPLPISDGTYSCGNQFITDIPSGIPRATRILYILIQIVVPIALVILGMLDLMKAVSAQKEDEIKRGQQTFIKRLIAAAIIFFVFALVKLAVGLVGDSSSEIVNCMNCFLRGSEYCD